MSNDVGERQHESLERQCELLRRLDTGKLLKLEKQRRGVPEDKLLFVNAANLARFWWCAQESLLQVREEEPEFFARYVLQGAEVGAPSSIEGSDPLELLRRVERVYKTHDPDEVLRKVVEKIEEMKKAGAEAYPAVKTSDRILTPIRRGDKLVVLEEGDECDLIKGGHSDVCREVLRAACAGPEYVGWAGDLGRRLARGELLEKILAQRHPTILWAKEWDRYVVVGIPDGIGEDFVYEFKSTRMSYGGLRRYVLPVARTQANIYAWLFKRQRWVVEIFSCEDLKLYRREGEVDYGDVERTLKGFKAAEEGGEILPPMCWKCESCKYRDCCRVKDRCRPSRRQGI